MLVRDPLDHARHRLRLADIGLDGADTRAPPARSSRRGGLEMLRLPAGDGDRGAGGGQRRGDAEPDPGSAAGDQRPPRPVRRKIGRGTLTLSGKEAGCEASARRNSGPWSAWSCAAPSVASACSSAPSSPRADETLDRADARGRAARRALRQRARPRRPASASSTTSSTSPIACARAASSVSPGDEQTERRPDADEAGQGEGRAAVGHQAHAGEGGGEGGAGAGEAQVAGEGEVEPEAGRRALRRPRSPARDSGRWRARPTGSRPGRAGGP